MQCKNIMNTPYTFPVIKDLPPFVVLEHIKLSNLMKQKATDKKTVGVSHAWVIRIDYYKFKKAGYSSMIDYILGI